MTDRRPITPGTNEDKVSVAWRSIQRNLRAVVLSHLGVVGAYAGIAAGHTGLPAALLVSGIALAIPYIVMYFLAHYQLREERKRREAGAAPSWFASVPKALIARDGGAANHERSDTETRLVGGRLAVQPDGLHWQQKARDSSRTPHTIHWDRSWTPHVTPWWFLGLGKLTLSRFGDYPAQMLIGNARDARKLLNEPHLVNRTPDLPSL